MEEQGNIARLFAVARDAGYRPTLSEDPALLILRRDGSTLQVHLELTGADTAFAYLLVRTSSWDFPGDRTDLHEALSFLLAFFLRTATPGSSCSLLDIRETLMRETELYGRYVTLDQPNNSVYRLDRQGTEALGKLLSDLSRYESLVGIMNDWDPQEEPDWRTPAAEAWATHVAQIIGEPLDDSVQFAWRRNPTWLHYRSIRTRITVFRSPILATAVRDWISQLQPWQRLPGINRALYLGNAVNNAVSFRSERLAQTLARKLAGIPHTGDICHIPLENYIAAAAGDALVILQRDCGQRRFEKEKERIRPRHERESRLLFRETKVATARLVWNESIDDEQFEMLVLALLNREPGVVWARKVGASKEPDSGRDLICEWKMRASNERSLLDDQSPFVMRRIVVQCKAYKKPVNKSNVQDIRDTVDHHNSTGYFLVVASSITRGLTEHLEKMRSEGHIWIDWWTRSEIEERLRAHPDLVARFDAVAKFAL